MKRIIAVLLALCLGVSSITANACSVRFLPPPWEVEFEEYGRIFIVREWEQDWLLHRDWVLRARSGLYYNTDPPVNIYYIDEYFFQDTTFFSGGGRYFLNVAPIIVPSTENEVIRFFADGEMVRSYQARDLVSRADQIYRINWGDYFWRGQDALEHDPQAGTLSLITRDGNDFTFDITTGEIIDSAEVRSHTFIANIADVIASMLIAAAA